MRPSVRITLLALLTLSCGPVETSGPCPTDWTPWITVAPEAASQGHIVVETGGPVSGVASLAGQCIYVQPDGARVQVVGCYLSDGYVCPR